MFTGIIEEVGRVRRATPAGGGRRLRIEASWASTLRPDQSIAVNGACQTVVAVADRTFEVIAIEETLRKTTLGAVREGAGVNLERAMRPGDRLDGHLVQGHVDATGTVVAVEPESAGHLYRIRIPDAFRPHVISVGSIAIDGISLTIARLEGSEIGVAIIPHTRSRTAISENWTVGSSVNLEFDLIGKYVSRWLETRDEVHTREGGVPLDRDWLQEKGF